MHNIPSVLAVLVAATSSSAKTSSSSAYGSLIFILLLAVLAYLFFIRPRSQQARRQREVLQEVGPGDEILTGAGIFGRVLDVEADRVTIETAPGTRLTVLRSTIARRLTETAEDASRWAGPDSSSTGSGSGEAFYESHEALGDGHAAGGDHDLQDGDEASDAAGEGSEGKVGPEDEQEQQSGGEAAAGGEAGSR